MRHSEISSKIESITEEKNEKEIKNIEKSLQVETFLTLLINCNLIR